MLRIVCRARAAREVDRKRVQGEHEHQQRGAEDPDRPDAGLGGRELVRAHDGDHPGVGRDPGQGRVWQPELGAELGHELAQVHRDDAFAGRDAVTRRVLEHVDELLLRGRVGVDPQLLHARRVEQAADRGRGGLPQRRGQRRRQRVEVVGQPRLELGGHVDVGIELVDEEDRDRVADLLVLYQFGAGLLPGLVVEHLPVHPRRQDRREPDQRGDDDQHPDQRRASPTPARRLLGVDRLAERGDRLWVGQRHAPGSSSRRSRAAKGPSARP